MKSLEEQSCVPCKGGLQPMKVAEARKLLGELPEWEMIEVDGILRLRREFLFADFAGALDFAVRVGGVAEEAGHHPRLEIEWGKTVVSWWTHAVGGLHKNDFILAARTDALKS